MGAMSLCLNSFIYHILLLYCAWAYFWFTLHFYLQPANFRNCKPAVDEKEKPSLDIVKESVLDHIRVLGGGIVESIVSPKAQK